MTYITKIRSNGRTYTVRDNRDRFFYPNEWEKFLQKVKPSKQYLFLTLLQTGGRISEVLNIVPKDFDFDRLTLTLRITKVKAKKGERVGRPRTFKVSERFVKQSKRYIRENNIKDEEKLFKITSTAVYQMFIRKLDLTELDSKDFGLHNIRKTCGNWLKALSTPPEEICLRLGHDYNTYLKHYASANIFNFDDRQAMERIWGKIY